MRKVTGFILIALLGLSWMQCRQTAGPTPPDPEPQSEPVVFTVTDKALAETSNGFGFELFQKVVLGEPEDQNIFISPLSVSYALGMTRNGAAGETWEAMVTVLRQAGMANDAINESYQSLTTGLTELDPTVQFNIANSIWYRLGKPIVPEFIQTSQSYFDALVREMDWNMAGAADTINAWIEENTNGKIKEMIKPPISGDIAMMLINAIYFKGSWTHEFDPDSTFDGTFHLEDGTEEPCRMMVHNDTVPYYQNDLFHAVDLPYGDEKFSMMILLPNYGVTTGTVLHALTEENWETWLGSFQEMDLPITLPKFKFEYKISLKDILVDMGMGIAFLPSADFSNMFADGVGWIDKVEHKTFVQVDEEGTEAAAVTVVTMVDSAMPGFYANKPFLFVIHEKETGTILFMGRVAKPEWKED